MQIMDDKEWNTAIIIIENKSYIVMSTTISMKIFLLYQLVMICDKERYKRSVKESAIMKKLFMVLSIVIVILVIGGVLTYQRSYNENKKDTNYKLEQEDVTNPDKQTESEKERKTNQKSNNESGEEPDTKSVQEVGLALDQYHNIPVFSNGLAYSKSYGKHYSKDGYYYGRKWQCVEYVKRYYYEELGHKMPNLYGNAIDFFDDKVPQGAFNAERGLVQYRNNDIVKPEPDDLMVFTNSKYGHVAIVMDVGEDYVEVIQQNVYGKPREKFALIKNGVNWIVGTKKKPAGWLRIKK